MSNDRLCVLYGDALNEYGFGDPHPFSRARLPAFWKEFVSRGLDRHVGVESPEMCDEAALLAFHAPEYVQFVKEASAAGTGYLDYGDTPAFKGVFQAAARVVGTTLKALRLVMEGEYRRAFCPLAGLHHARRDRAGGFCVFNDIGVVIEHLRRAHGIRRIGYVDIDAHHGDGVYYSFESDAEVFIADIHEDGMFLYPGTGASGETGTGPAVGTKLNLPMRPGSGEKEFMAAFGEVERFIDIHEPQIMLFQCGADSTAGDPLAELRFTPKCHAHAAERLRNLADRYASGRLLAMGGGGYSLSNIAAAWCAVVEALK